MKENIHVNKLWEHLILGDIDAFHQIYREHYVGLMNFGAFYFRDRTSTNDAIIEMFLDLWDRRSSLPRIENLRPYLISCLRNKILQKIKTQKWKDSKSEEIINHLESSQDSYEDLLIMAQKNEQLKKRLHKSFEKLTPRQRELLKLKFFDDLTYEEIASNCNITKRTAYNIIHDAIKILRSELSDGQNNISIYDVTLILSGLLLSIEAISN